MDERLFIRRFGFDASVDARTAVIALKNAYRLTDWQLRWLRWTGHLRVTRDGAAVKRSRGRALYGLLLLVVLTIGNVALLTAAIVAVYRERSVHVLPVVAAVTVLALLGSLIHGVHIRPNAWIRE